MGADLSLIAIPNRKLTPTPSAVDAQLIDRMLTEFPAALCIIDPIIAYTTGKDTNKASDVRAFLGPLTSIAEKHKTAVIIIRHLNKNSGNSAMYRGQGSIDFSATCRSGFIFARDPENSDRRLMSHYKSSLAKTQPTLEYFIDDDGSFRWGIESGESADDIVAPSKDRDRESAKVKQAKEFLEKCLEFGPMPSIDVKEKADRKGISWRTLRRAQQELNIKPSKERLTGAWWWRLSDSI
jgi:RecA-family ATPase